MGRRRRRERLSLIHILLLDTLLVMVARQGIAPALVVNKCDLDDGLIDEVRREYCLLYTSRCV